MKKSKMIGSALCAIVPISAMAAAPTYFEASGQTMVFKLTAGAKAGWSNSTAVAPKVVVAKAAFCIAQITSKAGVVKVQFNGTVPTNAVVQVYTLKGVRVASAAMTSAGVVSVGSGLPNGIYAMRVLANGVVVAVSRFVMGGK